MFYIHYWPQLLVIIFTQNTQNTQNNRHYKIAQKLQEIASLKAIPSLTIKNMHKYTLQFCTKTRKNERN